MVDRARAIQHFGSQEVMDSLLARFPETMKATMMSLHTAWKAGNREDVLCLVYQLRGAASWVCADATFEAAIALVEAIEAAPRVEGWHLDSRSHEANLLNDLEFEVDRVCDSVTDMCNAGFSPMKTPDNLFTQKPSGGGQGSLRGCSAAAPEDGQPSEHGASVLNAGLLNQMYESLADEDSLFCSMAKRFPIHFNRSMARLHDALRDRDWASLRTRAHSLKCGMGIMGATQMSGLAETLENLGQTLFDGCPPQEVLPCVQEVLVTLALQGKEMQDRIQKMVRYISLTQSVIKAKRVELTASDVMQTVGILEHGAAAFDKEKPSGAGSSGETLRREAHSWPGTPVMQSEALEAGIVSLYRS